jgi:hypothetical protein
VDDRTSTLMESAITAAMRMDPLRFSQAGRFTKESSDTETQNARSSKRCASACGFSIHANTFVPSHDRAGLEKLCTYGLRPAFSSKSVSLTDDGQVRLRLRKPWPTQDGVTVLTFEPVEFLGRLAPLIPPPYAHQIRYHGLFAPRAKLRDALPGAPVSSTDVRPEVRIRMDELASRKSSLSPDSPKGPPQRLPDGPAPAKRAEQHGSEATLGPHASKHTGVCSDPHRAQAPSDAHTDRPKRTVLPWSELLRRVFGVDVRMCPRCLGPMVVIAYLTDRAVIGKILRHLHLPTAPLPLGPARLPAQQSLFDDLLDPTGDPDSVFQVSCHTRSEREANSRGPPRAGSAYEYADFEEPPDTGEWGA